MPNVAIIGAGPSGITAARNCLRGSLDCVVFEQSDRIGGNWAFSPESGHSSVYENTHIISSKTWSQYEDFPMPPDYPDYPSHWQLQRYFEDYARHFGVIPQIRFRHRVDHVDRLADGRWRLDYTDAQDQAHQAEFDYLMVCNGHHWDPKYPQYPGRFDGTFMHSHDFKRCDDRYRDKRILVIGAGNSACDVAVETARLARQVSLSMRRGQWFIPKFTFGEPADVAAARFAWAPAPLRQWLIRVMVRLLVGDYRRIGLPVPEVSPLEQHPTLNSDLIDFIRHGKIAIRPAIDRLDGDAVIFNDGRREPYDVIIAATGYWISFPFFDQDLIDFHESHQVPLYRKMMHPDYPNLYFIGLFQPLGCIWPLADYQARLAVQEILGHYRRPGDLRQAIAEEMGHPHFNYISETRHSTEVDYHRFRRELLQELNQAA